VIRTGSHLPPLSWASAVAAAAVVGLPRGPQPLLFQLCHRRRYCPSQRTVRIEDNKKQTNIKSSAVTRAAAEPTKDDFDYLVVTQVRPDQFSDFVRGSSGTIIAPHHIPRASDILERRLNDNEVNPSSFMQELDLKGKQQVEVVQTQKEKKRERKRKFGLLHGSKFVSALPQGSSDVRPRL